MTAGVGGTTKKFAFSSAYQLGYTVGNLIGPQTYRASDAPNYYVGLTSKYEKQLAKSYLFASTDRKVHDAGVSSTLCPSVRQSGFDT